MVKSWRVVVEGRVNRGGGSKGAEVLAIPPRAASLPVRENVLLDNVARNR